MSVHVVRLQETLTTHTRMGDPKKLASCLRTEPLLKCIEMPCISSKKFRTAEKLAVNEYAVINGINTVADSSTFGCKRLLIDLCFQICQMNKFRQDPQSLYENIILRMSKQVASHDAYAALKKVMNTSNLALIVVDDGESYYEPTQVEIFESSGCLHARISTTNTFGVVIRSDIAGKAEIDESGYLICNKKLNLKPWVKFDVSVVENINFSTGAFVRYAKVGRTYKITASYS